MARARARSDGPDLGGPVRPDHGSHLHLHARCCDRDPDRGARHARRRARVQPRLGDHRWRGLSGCSPQRARPCDPELARGPRRGGCRRRTADRRRCIAAAAGVGAGACAARADPAAVESGARAGTPASDAQRLARGGRDLPAQFPLDLSGRHSIPALWRGAARAARIECGGDRDAVPVRVHARALRRVSADIDGPLRRRARPPRWSPSRSRSVDRASGAGPRRRQRL